VRVVALALLFVFAAAGSPLLAQPGQGDGSGGVAVTTPSPTEVEGSAADGSGAVAEVPVRVRVMRVEPGTFRDVPVANQEVDIHVVVPPHQIESTYRATTDASGEAMAMVRPDAGAEVTAEADLGGRVFSGSMPVAQAAQTPLEIRVRERTGDPSSVRASRIVTLIELWEGYLTFQEIYTLETSNGTVWSTDVEGARPVRVELPADAEGIRVIMPPTGAVVADHVVTLHGEVQPPDSGATRRPSLIVRYSLPHEASTRHVFERPLTMDVQAMSVVVPRETTFGRHPRLDINLTVPMCDAEFAAVDGRMCFTEITDDASDLPINEGVDVIVARGGVGVAGESVYVVSEGWPARRPWETWLAFGLGAAAFVGGLAMYFAERARRAKMSRHELERRALERRRDELLTAAADLEDSWQRGEIRSRERDDGRERLREQLGITRRRLRELGVVDAEGSQP
jgi:hypothetical protein